MYSIYRVARHVAYKNTLAYLTPCIYCTYVYRGIRDFHKFDKNCQFDYNYGLIETEWWM